jgi:dienelactone hydrolase
MGFSFGGRTALWASHPRFQQRYGSGPSRFAAHLAFYPTSCHIRLADEDRVGDAPIRIFHGAADEVTIISRCREYVAKLRNAGRDVGLFEYAGARHWFDNADLANRQTPTGVRLKAVCAPKRTLANDSRFMSSTNRTASILAAVSC